GWNRIPCISGFAGCIWRRWSVICSHLCQISASDRNGTASKATGPTIRNSLHLERYLRYLACCSRISKYRGYEGPADYTAFYYRGFCRKSLSTGTFLPRRSSIRERVSHHSQQCHSAVSPLLPPEPVADDSSGARSIA